MKTYVLYIRDNNHAQFFIEWEIFQAKFVEKLKTRILCSKTFLRKSYNFSENEKNVVRTPGQAKDGNIKRCMRFPCWITNATNTNSEYLILLACARQQWSRDCASLLRIYVQCPLVNILKPSSNCTYTFLQSVLQDSLSTKCISAFLAFLTTNTASFPSSINP